MTFASAVLLALAMVAVGAIVDAHAQAPAPEGVVYVVTYVEVMPTSRADGLAALRRYRDATRAEDGSLRCEVVSRLGQPHQFVVLEAWKDRGAFEAHGKSPTTAQMRERVQAIRNAPLDERVHTAASVGPLASGPGGDAVYVVTHVDVIPPRKEDGLTALKLLGDASRAGAGNLRFEVVQQTSRPNHFTVVEIWKDAKAAEAHSMVEATRHFRDALAPMSGALYDERFFRAE
jgi:quinol monooxygenase YgiN